MPQKQQLGEGMTTFFEKREEISFEEGTLVWNGRVIMPSSLRNCCLEALHEGHPGISAMRSSARMNVWWPAIDKSIEIYVKRCKTCQENRPREQENPLNSWSIPEEAWSRLHVDLAGPFEGKTWLILVDATSKWMEVMPLSSSTSRTVIRCLRDIFSRFGLPKMVVSDNGPQFTSGEFKRFCYGNNIEHVTSTPYHPKTNGLAERAVRTFKSRLLASRGGNVDLNTRLNNFLLSYRSTAHATTGRSPSEVLMKKKLRTRLTLLKPDISRKMDKTLFQQKKNHDRATKGRYFEEGDPVWVLNSGGKGWSEGKVLHRTGPLSYKVQVGPTQKRKHADQLRSASPA